MFGFRVWVLSRVLGQVFRFQLGFRGQGMGEDAF